jgi:hypothetical protein
MRRMKICFALTVLASALSLDLVLHAGQDWPVLQGAYLGQKPPGLTPEIFAPGIVSTAFTEQFAYFTPDGNELYWLLRGVPHSVILFTKQVDGVWTQPRVAPFSGRYFAKFCLSPDGNQVIFDSNQPLDGKGPPQETFHVWRVKRTASGWGEPEWMDSLVDVAAPSMARSGNLYFYLDQKDRMDIYMSEFIDGAYGPPVRLGDEVNSSHPEVDPFIAPDESYLIFCSARPGAFGLYVSFKQQDGHWSPAVFMGREINMGEEGSCCPSVSPDGRYLFFTNSRQIHEPYSERALTYEEKWRILNSPGNGSIDIYWVDAGVIEALKPKE